MKKYICALISRANLIAAFCALISLLLVNSCQKEQTYRDSAEGITDPAVLQAKAWYEGNYPQSTGISHGGLNNLNTTPQTTPADVSQLIKPDWHRTASYKRLGKDVMEIPIDHSSKFSSAFRNGSNEIYKKENSRTSFLLFKNGKNYQAYVMTIIGDDAYVKGDTAKLAHNTYRKHDADFSGVVLYFTPKGKFISSWQYKNGHIVPAGQINTTTNTNGSLKTMNNETPIGDVPCTYWYWAHYENGILVDVSFAFAICDDGTGGATSPSPCPPSAPSGNAYRAPGQIMINGQHDPIGTDPGPDDPGDPGDGGMPDPTNDVQCAIQVIVDSLKKSFPCASKLIDSLRKIQGFDSLTTPFNTSSNPSLTYTSGTLPWNVSSNGSITFQYGETSSAQLLRPVQQ